MTAHVLTALAFVGAVWWGTHIELRVRRQRPAREHAEVDG